MFKYVSVLSLLSIVLSGCVSTKSTLTQDQYDIFARYGATLYRCYLDGHLDEYTVKAIRDAYQSRLRAFNRDDEYLRNRINYYEDYVAVDRVKCDRVLDEGVALIDAERVRKAQSQIGASISQGSGYNPNLAVIEQMNRDSDDMMYQGLNSLDQDYSVPEPYVPNPNPRSVQNCYWTGSFLHCR